MEGISDGLAVDDCFVCAFLWPSDESCSACAKTMRYLPAMMVQNFDQAILKAKRDFVDDANQVHASTLSELIWLAAKYGFAINAAELPSRDALAHHVIVSQSRAK